MLIHWWSGGDGCLEGGSMSEEQGFRIFERSKVDVAKAKIRRKMAEGKGFRLGDPETDGFAVYVAAARELLAEEQTRAIFPQYLRSMVILLDDEFFAWRGV